MRMFFKFLVLIMYMNNLYGQYVQKDLIERVYESDLILEGKVVNHFCFKNEGKIYTAHRIEVCDQLYEKINNKNLPKNGDNIYIVTYGGTMSNEFTRVTHMLNINNNDEGIFFLRNSTLNPSAPPNNSRFYEPVGQKQGALIYNKDVNYDFEATSLFESVNDINHYISSINQITNQNTLINSCIQESKSGLVLRLDTIIQNNNDVIIRTSVKGQYSKEYKLQEVQLNLDLKNSIDLSNYNVEISSQNQDISTNYDISWKQDNNQVASFNLVKRTNSNEYLSISKNYTPFIELKFNANLLLNLNINKFGISSAKYLRDNEFFNFNEYDILNNEVLKKIIVSPNVLSFSPAEVCAGIKSDISEGNPQIPGVITIVGENFGNINMDNIAEVVPSDYRVEFVRESQSQNNSLKISPLAEDYIYWTDNEIKVRVPTAGWLVNGNNIFSNPAANVALTGRVNVKTPFGSDNNPDNQTNKDVVIKFSQFNLIDGFNPTGHSFPIKLVDNSGNGGYYLKFDPTFDNIVPFGSLEAAKQDVKDAFCEWNSITNAKLEVVDICPSGGLCFDVSYKQILTSDVETIAAAAGVTNSGQFSCPNEAIVNTVELIYNSEFTDWVPSSEANIGDPHVIKPPAYHEIGHLLQLGHVKNNGATMNPFYSNSIIIDNDAIAGGTHVSNVSAMTNCSNKLIQGINPTCSTNTFNSTVNDKLNLYPNPVDKKMYISLQGEEFNGVDLEIFNLQGKLVLSKDLMISDEYIDLSSLESGNYFVIVKLGNGSINRFIITKI